METKEYIVALHEGVDYNQFWAEMESFTSGLQFVPDRVIDIANNRTAFKRICEYALTDAEAEQLRNDPRVAAVEIPVRNNPYVSIVNQASPQQGNFNKTKSSNGNEINWGLVRHSRANNVYGTGTSTTEQYSYGLDGTGVDIVINDSGLQVDHPEFDGRVTDVGWDSYMPGGVTGINAISRQDSEGHGTHVAGIAAGKTYGWAKGAKVIPLTYYYPGDLDGNQEPLDIFEALINWHDSKKNSGNFRPTIVNMSWKLIATVDTSLFIGGKYRTNPVWSSAGKTTAFFNSVGLITSRGERAGAVQNETDPILPLILPFSSTAYNKALKEVIDAGIIVVQAAGNDGYKIDVEGGKDYDNYIISLFYPGKFYYHRGTSPSDPRVIVVGNMDSDLYSKFIPGTSTPKKESRSNNSRSNAGPRIDVWAAGTNVMSACSKVYSSDTASWKPAPYQHGDTSHYQVIMSGTSMAAPQVAGMCALYLQKYPAATPEEVRAWIRSTSIKGQLYSTGLDDDYTDFYSLLGSTAGIAYQNLQGSTKSYIKDDANTWRQAKAVWVKLDDGTWREAKAGWKKTEAGWEKIYEL
jgi:subtilisin family serine protease